MISRDYVAMLEQRECRGGCGLKFKVLPQSKQQYARSNCESYCREFRKNDYTPSDPVPNSRLEPDAVKRGELILVEGPTKEKEVKPFDLPVTLTSKEPEIMLAKETSVPAAKESSKVLKKKPNESEPVELDKKAPQKASSKLGSVNKGMASKISKAKQVICKACVDDAAKLSSQIHLLSSKMEIVYLHKTYCEFAEGKSFFESLSFLIKEEDFKKWQSVYFTIYERLSSKDWIQKYPVEDLHPLCHQINDTDSEQKIRQIVEEKLTGNYKTATQQSDKALTNLLSFYEKISFELLDDESLDKTYVLVKRLYNRFRSQMDKKAKR